MRYRHTQFGWVTVGTCGALFLLFACLLLRTRAPHDLLLLTPMAVIAGVVALFGTLTVEVDEMSIRLRFGLGLIRKNFALGDLASCQPVRNHWWWGWGIRLIPGGWLYKVSGFDAVELILKNGKKFRIGTDEPRQLAEFIQARLAHII